MNNKGFTLVELIATIALLAVIAIIGFVSINEVIKQSKVKDCETLIGNIKSAATDYVSDNRYGNLNIDNLTLKVLVDNNYLQSPVKNPFTKDNFSTNEISNVKISVTLYDNYTVKEIKVLNSNKNIDCKRNTW